MTIKVLSLWQPWAKAMLLKIKRNETRSWPTNHRGWLAIHAAKRKMTVADEELAAQGCFVVPPNSYGCVICIVKLVGCEPTDRLRESVDWRERLWGNYASGRYAWTTCPNNMIELPEPIPCRGRQGLFDWQVPEYLEKRLEAVQQPLLDMCATLKETP